MAIFLTTCRGCLLVKQSFFYNNPSNFVDLGGGVMGCRGFHSSFRGTQSGLSLNVGTYLSCMAVSVPWNRIVYSVILHLS
jgi:hypothetical protein